MSGWTRKPAPMSGAAQTALQVLSDLSLKHPCEMEIEDIGWARGILVREDDLTGSEGRLIKMGDKGLVTVKKDIPELGRKRFTIAHELGHFELHKNVDQLDMCDDSDLYGSQSKRPEEQEANDFATELLMPAALVMERCQNSDPTWETAKALSKDFQTTITLSAIRLVTFSAYRVALIVSEKGQIKWFRASRYFRYRIKTGIPVNPRTCAANFFSSKKGGSNTVPAGVWLKSQIINPDAEIFEDCFPLPRYETALSLIWIQKDLKSNSPTIPS